MRTFFFLFALLLCAAAATAQMTEEIETDRPDQTETPLLVPRKFIQAEFGMNAEKYGAGRSQLVHPASLLKYGLSNRFELRLETTVLTEHLPYIPATKTNTLLQPVEVGTKVRLFEEKGARPKVSLIAHIGLPFAASKQFRAGTPSYSARLSLQNSLTRSISLGYNLGVEKSDEPTAIFYTFAPGFSLGEKWYAYVEVFGSFANNVAEHNLDGGLAYFISHNTKIDLSSGFGLGDSPLKNYVAIGLSFRLSLCKP